MNKRAWTLVGAVLGLLITMGCSKQPPVEQEVVTPPANVPKVEAPVTSDKGQVAQGLKQESPVTQPQAATAPASPVKAIPGFHVVQVPDKGGHGEMHFLMAEEWKVERPSSMMRLYQASIPPAGGDKIEGEIAFFAPIGGSVEDNINRWTSQFTQPDGSDSKTKVTVEDIQGDKYKTKQVSLTGTMPAVAMPGKVTPPDRTGWMMLGAIIETPSGPWYIKATGPEKTLTAAKDKFLTLTKSVQIIEDSANTK